MTALGLWDVFARFFQVDGTLWRGSWVHVTDEENHEWIGVVISPEDDHPLIGDHAFLNGKPCRVSKNEVSEERPCRCQEGRS